ncbi:MAG: DUF5011 domain-containing protein, partial [Coriobacteriales bacterium]|nr:DUF5011 domain-containing protein [Coriobacteriales bacterium]
MGVLSKALAILLAVNMAVMFALPIGIFADEVTITGDIGTTYEESEPAAEEPEAVTPPNEDSAQTPAEDVVITPQSGFQPFGITPMAVNEARTWAEFLALVTNTSVSEINIMGDFGRGTAARLPAITRSLTINGHGHRIDFGANEAAFRFTEPAANTVVTINNLVVYRLGSATASNDAFFLSSASANLTLNIQGIRFDGEPVMRLVTSTGNALIRVGGYWDTEAPTPGWVGTTWRQGNITARSNAGKYGIEAQRVEFTAGPTDMKMGATVVRVKVASRNASASITVSPGADVTLENTLTDDGDFTASNGYGQCIWFDDIISGNRFTVNGGTIRGTSHSYSPIGDNSGAFNFNGTNFVMTIQNGGKVYATSTGRMAAFVSNVENCVFNVSDPGSLLNAESYRGYVDYQATLRFRNRDNQTFNVSNYAEVHVTKKLATPASSGSSTYTHVAAIRFGQGEHNTFNVTSGGKVFAINEGDGVVRNPGAIGATSGGNNVAVEFGDNDFAFNVSGTDSIVSLQADSGAAVNSTSRDGKVTVTDGAIFIADGRTAAADEAIFRVTGGSNAFTMTRPLYYDFRNRNTNGLIFAAGSSSTFVSTDTDLSVWTKAAGTNHEGDPVRSWSRVTYRLGGSNFANITTTDPTAIPPFTSAYYSGIQNYSRMSGNNANPEFTSRVLTNADKVVRFNGTVSEGLGIDDEGQPTYPVRAIWTGEVFGRVLHNGAGEPLHMTSLNIDNYVEEVLDSPLRGILRYDTGAFLIPGDRYELTSAWRGPVDDPNNTTRNHPADPDLLPDAVIVDDVTPPTPVLLTSHTDGGTIWTDRGEIKGTYADMSSVTYNSEPIDPVDGIYAVLNGDYEHPVGIAQFDTDGPGTWTINVDTTATGWQDNAVLSIIAEDTNGNRNPITATKYRDTEFPAAPSLTVREFPVKLSANNVNIALNAASAIQTDDNPLDRLEELIGAEANIKPGRADDWGNKGLGVTVFNDGGFRSELTNFELDAWRAAYGMDPKTYTIIYELDEDDSYTETATVTVWPYTDGDGYIFANDFEYSLNNTTALYAMTADARNAKLIELAEAVACENIDPDTGEPIGAFSSANVVVFGTTFPATASGLEEHQTYTVTFQMKNVPERKITVDVYIKGGNTPILNVTSPIHIWSGDPDERDVYAPDALLPSEFNMWDGVQAWAKEIGVDEITDDVTIVHNSGLSYDAATGDLVNPAEGTYHITYQVINSDSNDVKAVRAIVVSKGIVGGDYSVDAYDFVVTQKEVENAGTTAAKNTLILDRSYAYAQRLKLGASDPLGTLLPISVPANIRNLDGFSDQMGTDTEKNYTITIGAVTQPPTFTGDPLWDVNAKVIVKDKIARDDDPTASTHYVVAANNVRRTVTEVINGIANQGADAWLKGTAYPVAYEITGASRPNYSKTTSVGVSVLENNIPSTVVPGTYTVKFTPAGEPDVICVVNYEIYGTPPVITPEVGTNAYDSGYPLVIEQTPGVSHKLTDAEMKAKMTVIDGQDGNIIGAPGSYPSLGANVGTTYVVAGGTEIDTQNVGVYQVTYTATDSDGMTAELTRAIVVTDGRYVIEKGNLGNPSDGTIIGAQNFVIKASDIDPTTSVVRSAARAFAYNENGTPVGSTNIYIDSWPVGYVRYAIPDTYSFTFKVTDRIGSKTIHGYVVDADEIYHGTDNEQHSLALSNFTKNPVEAWDMVTSSAGLKAEEILAAHATVYPLVDDAPAARPYVITDNGFPGARDSVGVWDIRIAIERSASGGVYPGTQLSSAAATIKGTVSRGGIPILEATTPVEVQQGTPFSLFGGVSLRDAEDGDPLNNGALDPEANLTVEYTLLPTGQTAVNTDVPGLYGITYSFEDNDHNPVEAKRIVVVNDGHYTVSATDKGRVLYANSFLIKSTGVEPDSAQLNRQIMDKAGVMLYDGETGVEVASDNISVTQNNGYSSNVREYGVTLQAVNNPSGVMTRNITAKVVDASELGPGAPNVFGPTTYVYGKSIISIGVGEAEQIAAGGLSAVLTALKADSTFASAAGALSDRDVKITADTNNFITRLTTGTLAEKKDTFSFEVSDTDDISSVTLTITVSEGDPPVITMPKPQNFDMAALPSSNLLDGNGNLTSAAIMLDVVATDEQAKTPTNLTGTITSDVTYVIEDVNGDPVSAIPGNVAALYKVTYSVEDADHNWAHESRALIVNDGRFVHDGEYILSARSFIINQSLTTLSPASEQIRQYSEARAWKNDGTDEGVTVSTAGYPNGQMNFVCTIRVSGHGNVEKNITARIVSDVIPPALPGASDTDWNSDNGDRYAIAAHNFRINTTDAAALVAKAGTAAYATELLSRANATAYDRTTEDLGLGSTAVFVDDGGFALAENQPLAEGNIFSITFKVAQDDEATTTIKAFVSDALSPTLTVPAYKKFPLNAVITPAQYMEGVSASDPEDGEILQSAISYDASAVDTSVRGHYSVIYSVTDKDHNTTTKQGVILIDLDVIGDYAIDAHSFVKLEGSVAGSDTEILESSYARAWRVNTNDPDIEWSLLPIEVTPSVGPVVKAKDSYASGATARDYTIQLGVNPEPGYGDDNGKTIPITARVIDRDIISNVLKIDDNGTPTNPADDTTLSPGIDQNTAVPTDSDRYVIAADNATIRYSEVAGYVGSSPATIGRLIEKAQPVAYRMAGNTATAPATITGGNVQLALNGNTIPATAIKGQSFWVTFNYENLPSIYVTVKFTVIQGNDPMIEFDKTPLVINQTHENTAQKLPDTVLDDDMRFWDVEDLVVNYQTQLAIQVVDGNDLPIAEGIDSNKIGVYKVKYVATDGDGNTATAYRAVVITDGRYTIPDEDNDGKLDEGAAILGARNFVVKQADVVATRLAIQNRSWAEAFDREGTALTVTLVGTPPIPDGYTTGTADEGEYEFIWGVTGYNAQKQITGTVVVADVVDSGTKDSQYSIVASHFWRNIEDA